jgi:3-oxoacid CoA-transferase B subunit
MDLVTGAKRVIVAMQHTAKGKPKIMKTCTLPVTSVRRVDLVVTELAVISFPDGKAKLLERGPGISVEQVVAATQATANALRVTQPGHLSWNLVGIIGGLVAVLILLTWGA